MTDKNRRFAASYSGGKDGALAIYRAKQSGFNSETLLTTYNESAGRSWFHGVPDTVLYKVSELMEIPMEIVRTVPGTITHTVLRMR